MTAVEMGVVFRQMDENTLEETSEPVAKECSSHDRQNSEVYRAMEGGNEDSLRAALKEALATSDEAVIDSVVGVFKRFKSTAPRTTPSLANDQRTADRKHWPDLLNSPKPLKSGS